ncbi:Arrestin-like 5 [Homarus americanus]|uniref:Arrestin-like 5 n=1 Tax=Homarus americanus TaxID=6706 RepID=A0A8J5J9Q8_HOMAM|nr:Arrestin-like 5 [Homarus americanus]
MITPVKVFKKSAPNDGVVVVDNDYLHGRKVFLRLAVTYRYGREEDEVMGLHFSKEMELVKWEVVPKAEDDQLTDTVIRLLQKLGNEARPFSVKLPQNAPSSVTLEPGAEGTNKKLGVTYDLMFYVADNEELTHRRNSVNLAVRKIQYAPEKPNGRQPQIIVTRSFTLHPGKLKLEVYLERDIYFHGQSLQPHVKVTNASKKTVKYILAQVIQHVDITMTNTSLSRIVASIESREGCPITPNTNYSRSIVLTPLAFRAFGVALDGQIQDKDANLASSTMVTASNSIGDALGIIVSYTLRVKLNCGALGGELTTQLPFKLMHPQPSSSDSKPTLSKTQSVDDNLEIEEFNVLRRGQSVTDELDD